MYAGSQAGVDMKFEEIEGMHNLYAFDEEDHNQAID
jgi:hypothetical protein